MALTEVACWPCQRTFLVNGNEAVALHTNEGMAQTVREKKLKNEECVTQIHFVLSRPHATIQCQILINQ